jgi:hypothetical protein
VGCVLCVGWSPLVGIKHYNSEHNYLLGLNSRRALTRLAHIGLEDFFLALQYPDFFTPQVGGFINNTLRGLLQVNYKLYTYNATLHNCVFISQENPQEIHLGGSGEPGIYMQT